MFKILILTNMTYIKMLVKQNYCRNMIADYEKQVYNKRFFLILEVMGDVHK